MDEKKSKKKKDKVTLSISVSPELRNKHRKRNTETVTEVFANGKSVGEIIWKTGDELTVEIPKKCTLTLATTNLFGFPKILSYEISSSKPSVEIRNKGILIKSGENEYINDTSTYSVWSIGLLLGVFSFIPALICKSKQPFKSYTYNSIAIVFLLFSIIYALIF